MWFQWKWCSCNQALILQKVFCWSRGTNVTIKGVRAFLDMRRCKDWDHEISFWKYPPKDLFYQFPWSTKYLIFHPELPSGHVKGQLLLQHRNQSSKKQIANALGSLRSHVEISPIVVNIRPIWSSFDLLCTAILLWEPFPQHPIPKIKNKEETSTKKAKLDAGRYNYVTHCALHARGSVLYHRLLFKEASITLSYCLKLAHSLF